MSLDLVVKVRKPTRVITRPWAAYVEAATRYVRGRQYSDCYFDPYAGAVMLTPQVDPSNWPYGKGTYTLEVYNGTAWVPKPEAWVEGEGAFGDVGGYVGFAGNTTYPTTTPWAAYRSSSLPIPENYPINFSLHWTPPPPSASPDPENPHPWFPRLEFWPRVDTSKWATINGRFYFFAPLGLYLDAQTASLVVCEYQHDTYDRFVADPTTMLEKTYQHPLNLGIAGLVGGWMTFKILPVLEEWVKASDGLTYRHHDFLVQSPMLKNGGFCYRTCKERTNIGLFPRGMPGIRSLTGGVCALSIAPIYFASTGYVLSQVYSKREEDTERPNILTKAYFPDGSEIDHSIVYPESYPTPFAIPFGESFQQYRIKSDLTATPGDWETPILYSVGPDLTGAAEDRAQAEIDISADVTIRESMTEDSSGYRASITLRNPDGIYNEYVYRPLSEITFSFASVNRSILYTLNPHFQWYQTPTDAALLINWECGDFWVRLQSDHITGMPDYGNQTISAAITDYLTRLGFDPDRIHIAASLALPTATLPRSPDKDDPLVKPQDGSTADEFLKQLHDYWFSTYPMYFGVDDDVGVLKPAFFIDEPLNPNDPANIHRTFYLSRAQAEAAGEADPYYCRQPTVSFMHDQYYNEIWMYGLDPVTGEPIVDLWLDKQSQVDESYLYYVGERRIHVAGGRLPTKAFVTYALWQLVKLLGTPRRQISFNTKYDATLRPGHFIKFKGINLVFLVTSAGGDIAAGKVSTSEDDTVYDCPIEAVQWPT